MKRILSVERLYTLGDYKNIKIINALETTEDAPDNTVATRLLLKQLSTECDLAYQDYKAMNEEISKLAKEGTDVRELLQQERDRVTKELAEPLIGYTGETED